MFFKHTIIFNLLFYTTLLIEKWLFAFQIFFSTLIKRIQANRNKNRQNANTNEKIAFILIPYKGIISSILLSEILIKRPSDQRKQRKARILKYPHESEGCSQHFGLNHERDARHNHRRIQRK